MSDELKELSKDLLKMQPRKVSQREPRSADAEEGENASVPREEDIDGAEGEA